MTLPVVFTANGPSGYNLTKSLRFRSSAGAWLNRTPATTTNRQTYTWSGWVKTSLANVNGSDMPLLTSRPAAGTYTLFQLKNSNTLQFSDSTAGGSVTTTQVFRDPSAWYHIVLAVDTTQATAANRVKMYVNGVQITAFSSTTYPAQNGNTQINVAQTQGIGRDVYDTGALFDGYLAEVNFIDGQQLTPSSFGSTNALTGVWQPAKYTGTYGTNGFYLPFTDNSATTPVGLGKDFSGNAGTAIVGTTTSGSNSMTVVSLTGIAVGNTVTGPGIPTGTYVTAASVLTVTLSQNATSSNVSQSYTFAGNNWFCNNISLTTGSTYDSMTDVPTLTSTTTANYCTLNPLTADSNATFSKGNLTIASNTTGEGYIPATIDFNIATTVGYYFEVTVDSNPAYCTTGFMPVSKFPGKMWTGGTYPGQSTYNPGFEIRFSDGTILQNGGSSAYGSGATAGDTWGFAVKNGKVWARNSSGWFNSGNPVTEANPAVTGQTGQWLLGYAERAGGFGAQCTFNFGAGSGFAYTPPTGFVALNTYNLPTSTIVKGNTVMDATLYTGTGATLSVVNTAGFKPDFVWAKGRSAVSDHLAYDSVRGATLALLPDLTAAEVTLATGLTSFNSNGFTLGSNANNNTNGVTYVGWQWQAGQGTTSSNTSGSITSTVSVNASAGFSVVTYTGTGSNATVGHGLGVAPKMIIIKSRVNAYNWVCYNSNIGNTKKLYLDLTDAEVTDSTAWNNTSPTSSTFSLGSNVGVNQSSSTYVAYCWSEIAGFSKFGSYTGNGSTDGPFVYTGFRPAFIMIKRTDSGGTDWVTMDYQRLGYNVTDVALNPNANYAENSGYATDFTANGFKLRTTTSFLNGSGATYIYMAFAQNPFKNALAR